MGILDDSKATHGDTLRRQRVIRANIRARADKNGIPYRKAVEEFANEVDRSPWTVFMWISSGTDGKGGSRTIPARHFDKMVEAGLIDPDLTHWQGQPADAKIR